MHTSAPLRTTCLIVAVAAGTLALTACAPPSDCAPAPLTATLDISAAGATLEVAAAGVGCDPVTGDLYELTIVTDSGPYSLGTALPADDGSFRQSFPVPLGIIDTDEGVITVTGSSHDQCDDGADCGPYQVALPTP